MTNLLIRITSGFIYAILVLVFTTINGCENGTVVDGNYVPKERLENLLKLAKAGDVDAQMDLSVVSNDKEEGRMWLEKAAATKHPPAVNALANDYRTRGGDYPVKARSMLESIAKDGYYPAITDLTLCLNDGNCGPRSVSEAYMWTVVSRLLAERHSIAKNVLQDDEKSLSAELTKNARKNAEINGHIIVDKMQKVTDLHYR